ADEANPVPFVDLKANILKEQPLHKGFFNMMCCQYRHVPLLFPCAGTCNGLACAWISSMLCAFTALPKNASFCYQYTVLHEKGQCAALISGRFVNKIRNCSTNSAMFCIIYGMESKWQKKRDRETKWKVTLRRIRIPLLTVLGAFFVALVGFPLLLNSVTSEALSAEFPIGVPSATPLPLPTEGQPLAIEQILPEKEPAQSPEDAESTVSS